MRWLKSFNESSKFRDDLLLFNLEWQEFLNFLEDRNFDISKLVALNKTKNKFLNKGKSGLIYEYDSDKVIKVSTDLDDFRFFLKLKDKNLQHFPKVYDVLSLNNGENSLLFIVMEKCDPLPKELENFIRKYIRYIQLSFIKNSASILNAAPTSLDFYILKKYNLIQNFNEIMEELTKIKIDYSQIQNLDLHEYNFMIKEGKICMIDFLIPKRYRK